MQDDSESWFCADLELSPPFLRFSPADLVTGPAPLDKGCPSASLSPADLLLGPASGAPFDELCSSAGFSATAMSPTAQN